MVTLRAVAVAVILVGAAAGCGGSNAFTVDEQHGQRIAAEAAGYQVAVRCHGDSCSLNAHIRLHSRDEATLIGWPILLGWATDPSLSSVQHATLRLSDSRTGAQLILSCRRADAQRIPTGETSVAAVRELCPSIWRSSY